MYIVLAICFTSFITYPLCATVNQVLYEMKLSKTPDLSDVCVYLAVANSSINFVFYLFITTFRSALAKKIARCSDTYLMPPESLNLNSTQWTDERSKATPISSRSTISSQI
ncbi:hypothetical protein ACOMHN_027400 [Nucella lapillus]